MTSCLAIDIGGTKIASALVSAKGEMTERYQLTTPQSTLPDQLEQALAELIRRYSGLAHQVAVASTGIIKNGHLTALNAANLGGLNNFPLSNVIEKLSGLPVSVINDAQAAGWAEYSHLSLHHSHIKNMAFITVSTGVGGGIVCDGQLLTGQNGIAGHIGHTLFDPHGPNCGCGRQGCVEAVASGRAIAAAAKDDLVGCDCKEIFQHAKAGHANASALITRSANAITQLVANLKMTFDVEYCVIGGSVGLAEGYLQEVQRHLQLLPTPFQTQLITAHYQQNAGLLGAAKWAMKHNGQ